MTTLPQPEPDAPAPPPSAQAIRSQVWWGWIWIGGVISVLGVIKIVTLTPQSSAHAPLSRVFENAKSIGIALYNFEQDYSSYPSPATIKDVTANNPSSTIPLGTKSSNDFFRQLIVAGHTDTERPFYAKIKGSRKPDNNMTGAQALEKGECGFAYILGADAKSPSERPLVVTPLIPGTKRFDPKPFKGRAVVLRVDQSVTNLSINRKGEVIDATGKNILDPSHPAWGGKPPVIAWPE